MKKLIGALALACALTLTTGCISGPNRLSNGWNDWVNQKYTESSWIHGALLQNIIPVYPLVGAFMSVGDFVAVNTYYFWSDDAWDNRGTGFVHENPADAQKTVISYFKD